MVVLYNRVEISRWPGIIWTTQVDYYFNTARIKCKLITSNTTKIIIYSDTTPNNRIIVYDAKKNFISDKVYHAL